MMQFPRKLFLSCPHMGGEELGFIHRAFEQNWIAPLGENVDEFERELSHIHEGRSVAALSSGTAALHLALSLAGVRAGDVVLCQSFTFCASAFPITYLGAEPVFVGSEAATWNMCPDALEQAIEDCISRGRRPKAVVFVNLYGAPAMVDEIITVARRYELSIIEDAAESLGSTYKGRPTGVLGDFGVLSFNGNKIITTSGGGALICRIPENAEAAKFLSTQARDRAPYYLHSVVGYNYRLSNICAGIGRGQLRVLNDRVRRRREIFGRYRDAFERVSTIRFREEAADTFENRWLTAVLLEKELLTGRSVLEIVNALAELNIECRPLWNPLHLQPVFKGCSYFGQQLERDFFVRGLCLPSASIMSNDEQDFVISAFSKVLGIRP